MKPDLDNMTASAALTGLKRAVTTLVKYEGESAAAGAAGFRCTEELERIRDLHLLRYGWWCDVLRCCINAAESRPDFRRIGEYPKASKGQKGEQ